MTGNDARIILQDRDRHLLEELAVMRVIDREQAKRVAGFGSTTRANCRLLGLLRAGLLRRFFEGTGGGSRKALYALSQKGATLAHVPYRGPRRKQDETLVADFFVTHQLRINEVYCTAKYPSVPPAFRFIRWLTFHEPVAGSDLIPDGYLEVALDEAVYAMFLEVDLGHESRSVWQRKVQAYLQFALSGRFAEAFGHKQFRTLVVGDSDRRIASLRAATAEVTTKIFWFTTFQHIEREVLSAAIWQRPTGDERIALMTRPT